MKIKSFAKINLGLEIVRKRPDNYHDILTLFQAINLSDDLEIVPADRPGIVLEGDLGSIAWDETNLISRAARLLQDRFDPGRGAQIRVTKRIPPGKGLGGGSSNAAMTLYALNALWSLGLEKKALIALGKELGSDVPYFLEGGFCLGRERGDAVIPLTDLPPFYCVLAMPPFPVWTAEIYERCGASLTSEAKDSKIIQFLENGDFGFLENALEKTVFSSYPQLEDLKRFFQSQGAELSLLSGSGSSVFGLFRDRQKAETGRKALRAAPSVLVETLTRNEYWARIRAGVSPSW